VLAWPKVPRLGTINQFLKISALKPFEKGLSRQINVKG
jgi:hypothetical protein